ncbi:hypothetical protein BDW22DRAFT_1266579 [Trametopsis cervina]|nr:hypothetical protein BDW22DRAFT_1266579 [Trametopsis cervina]
MQNVLRDRVTLRTHWHCCCMLWHARSCISPSRVHHHRHHHHDHDHPHPRPQVRCPAHCTSRHATSTPEVTTDAAALYHTRTAGTSSGEEEAFTHSYTPSIERRFTLHSEVRKEGKAWDAERSPDASALTHSCHMREWSLRTIPSVARPCTSRE